MNAALPAGMHARPVTMEDLEPMVEMFNKFTHAQIGMNLVTLDGVRTEWLAPVMNLATNTVGVFDDSSRPVGYMEFWDSKEPHVAFNIWGAIHPDFRGCGIGSYLVEWAVERGRQNVGLAPQDTRVVLDAYIEATDQNARALFTRYGFQDIRSAYWMRIDFDQAPQPPEAIAGITIRHINGKQEERAALEAAHEAFKDHWGFIDEPFDTYYERYQYFIQNDPHYDPTLWFVALDGEEVAGVSLCRPNMDGSPDLGWVNTLGVRRPWRKRGVGLALLQHSFYELHRRGRKSVGLGVDASSLTGATRLYEKAGMHIMRQHTLYQMELRPGKDLQTRELA